MSPLHDVGLETAQSALHAALAAPAAGLANALQAFAQEAGLQFALLVTAADSALQGAQALVPPESASAAALAGVVVIGRLGCSRPTPATEAAARALLNGGLRTGGGGSLRPIHDALVNAAPERIWASRQARGGQAHPASMLMFGAPVLLTGPDGFHESFVLQMVREATGLGFASVADLHARMRLAPGGVLGRDFATIADGVPVTWDHTRLMPPTAIGRAVGGILEELTNPGGELPSGPPTARLDLALKGYRFRAGDHYVSLDPRTDAAGTRYLAVQLHRDARAFRDNQRAGRMAGYEGPAGVSSANARLVISTEGPAAAPAGRVCPDIWRSG